MKRTLKITAYYVCSRCKTRYTNKKKAEQCEKRFNEKKKFKVGDTVQNIEPRVCRNRSYTFIGKVVTVSGPEPADYEYEVKWLGGKNDRVNGHIYRYLVEFSCPNCKAYIGVSYYAPELKAIRPSR